MSLNVASANNDEFFGSNQSSGVEDPPSYNQGITNTGAIGAQPTTNNQQPTTNSQLLARSQNAAGQNRRPDHGNLNGQFAQQEFKREMQERAMERSEDRSHEERELREHSERNQERGVEQQRAHRR